MSLPWANMDVFPPAYRASSALKLAPLALTSEKIQKCLMKRALLLMLPLVLLGGRWKEFERDILPTRGRPYYF